MHTDIVVQRPAEAALTRELILLFHGVGSSAEDLQPLAQAIADHRPGAFVVSVRGPDASDLGRGWQWFSVQGVTEANRPARVAATMERFIETIRHWQHEAGLETGATTLLGFSQGAIMALESTQQPVPPAQRVVAIAGRFAQEPRVAPAGVALHVLHGEQDGIMPPALASQAVDRWRAQGGTATLDRFPGLGHGIDERVLRRVLHHLAG